MCRGDIVILLSPFSRMVPKSVAPFPSWDEALSSSSLKNAASDDYVKRQALVHVPGTSHQCVHITRADIKRFLRRVNTRRK